MGAMNDSFSFERDPSPVARTAFSPSPKRTPFPEGVEFFRIVTCENRRTGEKGNEIFGSPRVAVAKEFNPKMDCFCTIYLTRPACGWTGKANLEFRGHPSSAFGPTYLDEKWRLLRKSY
jgi:hypothetical protein